MKELRKVSINKELTDSILGTSATVQLVNHKNFKRFENKCIFILFKKKYFYIEKKNHRIILPNQIKINITLPPCACANTLGPTVYSQEMVQTVMWAHHANFDFRTLD